jgi:hypothetical protein
MAEKKPRDNFRIVVTALCIVIAVSFTAVVFSIQVTDLENQIRNMQEGRIVNVSLAYSDNGKGVIHVSGYLYNPETTTAYGCNVQVALYRDGVITNSSVVFFGNDTSETQFGSFVSGETSAYVDANVTYTGAPPTNVTLKLGLDRTMADSSSIGAAATTFASFATLGFTISGFTETITHQQADMTYSNQVFVGYPAMAWLGVLFLSFGWAGAFYSVKRIHFGLGITSSSNIRFMLC